MKTTFLTLCVFLASATAFAAGEISFPKQIRCKDIANTEDAVLHLFEAPILTHAEQVTNRSDIVNEPTGRRMEMNVDDLKKVVIFTGDSRFPESSTQTLENYELARVNNAYQWGITLTSKELVYSFHNSSSGVFVSFDTEDLISGHLPITATVRWTHDNDNGSSNGSFTTSCGLY
jgi:hypothetical protein